MSTNTSNFKIEPVPILRRWRNTAIVVGFFGLIVVGLPVLLPYVLVQRWRHRRRLSLAARALRCTSCGEMLDDDAFKAADRHWRADVADYARRHPGVRFNFHRPYDVVCPRCETRYAYRLNPPSFVPVSALI